MDGQPRRSARNSAPRLALALGVSTLGALAVALAGAAGIARSQTASPASCSAQGPIAYLCGPKNIEDMEQVPGTPLLVAASYGLKAGPNSLALIDTRSRTAAVLPIEMAPKPDAPYAACPGPVDLAQFSAHGLALRPGAGGKHTLYVVNHGGRESIEVFAFDASQAKPKARWIGCVVLPKGASGNAVAPLPDGGFVATKFFDPRLGPFVPQFAAHKRTSVVYRWSPKGGWNVVPGGEATGDNGILVSPDGAWVYVSAWVDKAVIRLPLKGSGKIVRTKVDFMPDNLRWAPDGSILIAGQATDIDLVVACKRGVCAPDWGVARLDPKSMAVSYLYWEKGTNLFAGATTAVQVGDKLWLGTFNGDRLAIADVPKAPLKP